MNEQAYFEQFVGDTTRRLVHGLYQGTSADPAPAEACLQEYKQTHEGNFVLEYVNARILNNEHNWHLIQLIDA